MDIQVKNVFINSFNRDTTLFPNGNNYTLFLSEPIKQIKKVELVYASIPNTILNLTNGSNVIAFSNANIKQDSLVNLTKFSLPLGFYGASGLATEITNAVSNNTGITTLYLQNEGKYLFSRSTAADGPFTMSIATAEMAALLGFPSTVVGNLVQSSNVATVTGLNLPLYSDNTTYRGTEFIKSQIVVSMNPAEGVFLDIPELRTICNTNADKLVGADGTSSGQNISRSFGIIPMDVASGSVKRFKKSSDYDMVIEFPYPIQSLNRITINWVDIYGQLINFNGLDANSCLLRFHVIPSK
jgi:hypothetical protein